MIKSMTAFGRSEKQKNTLSVAIEIRSYNSRHLDIALRLPHGYHMLEERIKEVISERINRGRIEVFLQLRENGDGAAAFEINEPLAVAYHKALVRLKNMFGIDEAISLNLIASATGIVKPAETERDIEMHWTVIKECAVDALLELDDMRKKEGNFISRDVAGRLDYIEKCIRQIKSWATDLLPIYHERLKERISALTKGIVEIDPSRIAQEAALLADRSDISEEIVRTDSHLKQFREIMASEEPGGRKLNFLLQEFNREFNTMGSKASSADISHVIVDLKAELEKIREQIQNVE